MGWREEGMDEGMKKDGRGKRRGRILAEEEDEGRATGTILLQLRVYIFRFLSYAHSEFFFYPWLL